MTDNGNSAVTRLRERMRDARTELEKVQTPAVTGETSPEAGSSQEVERVLLLRDANREMLKILGSR